MLLNCDTSEFDCDSFTAGRNYHMHRNWNNPTPTHDKKVNAWRSSVYRPHKDHHPPEAFGRCNSYPGPLTGWKRDAIDESGDVRRYEKDGVVRRMYRTAADVDADYME